MTKIHWLIKLLLKLEAAIAKLERDIASKMALYEQLEEEVKTATEHAKTFYQYATQHETILNEVKTLETEKELMIKTLKDLRDAITELPGTREDLQIKRDGFAREAQEKLVKKRGFTKDTEGIEDEANALNRKRNKLAQDLGSLKGDEKVRCATFRLHLSGAAELTRCTNAYCSVLSKHYPTVRA